MHLYQTINGSEASVEKSTNDPEGTLRSHATSKRFSHPPTRLAYNTSETCLLLGGISKRSLRRLSDRQLLVGSKGLRTTLYSHADILKYLEATK